MTHMGVCHLTHIYRRVKKRALPMVEGENVNAEASLARLVDIFKKKLAIRWHAN